MKKPIIILGLVAGIYLAACQTQAQKDAKAEDKTQDSIATQQANAQYLAFKRDAESEIAANNDRIAHLRDRLAKTQGTAPLDDARKRKIDDLERRNADLRATLIDYKYQSTDWETFKAKWNHEKDDVNKAFNDADNDLKQ